VVGKLESALRGVMDRDRPGLVLNLSGLDYISSAGVGIFFGLIPAFKAAIIHPIDALRHE